jgi:2-dehydropantoate 2-reductase
MKFVVYGAGAVGGLVGALLSDAGHQVVLIARGAHGEAMRRDGLLVQSPAGSRRFAVEVVGDPDAARIETGDVVFLGMKSQDTAAALDALDRCAARSTLIVCLQNGVENERAAQRIFSHVYGVCVICPATHLEPGTVVVSSDPIPGLLDIGRYPGGTDANTELVAAALRSATFESVEREDIMRWKYNKLLLNLVNAVEVVCQPGGRGRVTALARQEAVACFQAAGIEYVSEEEEAERRVGRINIQPVAGQERGGGSSWQSVRRGTGSIETDYLTGEIVLLGRLHGVPTPVNTLLQEIAADLAHHRAEPGQMPVDDFLSRIS